MKSRMYTPTLIIGVIVLSFLLGTNSVNAAEVVFGDSLDPTKATGITGLVVNNSEYTVAFLLQRTADELYGEFPGVFPIFDNAPDAEAAVDLINIALRDAGATAIGEDGVSGADAQGFNIGFESFILDIGQVESIYVWRSANEGASDWVGVGLNELAYNLDERAWADFTFITPTQLNSWGNIKVLYR